MIEPTYLSNCVTPATFLAHAIKATTSFDIEALLAQLPIAPEDEYIYDEENPDMGWHESHGHVGLEFKLRPFSGSILTLRNRIEPPASTTR